MLSYYGSLSSKVYDIDKPIGHSFGDVEFYIDRLKDIKGPILEPATGTGRILIPLLEQGLDVSGFDISLEMLNICKENCRIRDFNPEIFQGRMEEFKTDKKYNAIVIPTGTFLLLHKREDSIKALKNFYNHLIDGGKLILDIYLETGARIGDSSTKMWECQNKDIITLENKVIEVDYINQYVVSYGRYERWRDGVLIQTELEYFPIRWYGIEEFRLILESIGFSDIRISSNYTLDRYPKSLSDMVTFEAVAKK